MTRRSKAPTNMTALAFRRVGPIARSNRPTRLLLASRDMARRRRTDASTNSPIAAATAQSHMSESGCWN